MEIFADKSKEIHCQPEEAAALIKTTIKGAFQQQMERSIYIFNMQDALQEKEYNLTTRGQRENAIQHRWLSQEGLPLNFGLHEYSQNGTQQYPQATLETQPKSEEDQEG